MESNNHWILKYVLLMILCVKSLSADDATLEDVIRKSSRVHRNFTALSEFRTINRRVLPDCSASSPNLKLMVNVSSSNSSLSDDEFITVTVSGVSRPSHGDWVAMISPSNSNVNTCLHSELYYVQTGDIAKLPLLCHYPVKAQFMSNDPNYLNCKSKACSGSIKFHVINIRTDIEFVFFTGGFLTPCFVGRSKPLTFSNPKRPLYGHLSSTDSTSTSMRLTWVSGDNQPQQVQYANGKSATSVITTFSQDDMCSSALLPSPAKDFGWHDPGYIHSAVMTGLSPSTTFNYRYGSDSVGWSEQMKFLTPPAGGSDELRFITYGDMGKTPLDDSQEHYIQPGALSVISSIDEEVKSENVDSVFHIGDISYATGFLAEWDFFLSLINPVASRVSYMTAIGNHERDYVNSGSVYITPDSGGECGVAYETYFPMPTSAKDKPWYSIEQASVHFTVISTEHDWSQNSEQYAWMKKDMASVNRQKTPWLIFMGHRPMYTSDHSSADKNFVAAVEPLLLANKQAALVLNASRRFRYILDLKKEEEKEQVLRKIRGHVQVIKAAYLFKESAKKLNSELGIAPHPTSTTGEFQIGLELLSSIARDHNTATLQEKGGVEGIASLLETNLEKGIQGDDTDLSRRTKAFGSNNYPRKKGRSFLMFVWDACKDLTLIILMVAAAASLVLGIKSEGIKEGWYDGGSIAFAVILVIVVTAISDYKQSLQFRDLNEEKRNIRLEVIRGGRRVEISIYDIVVGDVIPLNIGDQVPADGILIVGHSLAVDESSMTGESNIVEKNSKNPILISGCKVADGNGLMLVTAVGINTEWGLLMANISEDNGEETPLQVRLNGLATFIGIIGLSVAVIVLVVLLARYFSGHSRNPDGSVQFTAGKTKLSTAIDGAIKIVTVAVTIVVVAVPEGLPLAVTLTLAYSMRKMMADKALVRRLSACETMGSATTICSDKTGTLTMNQMTVVEAIIGGENIDPPHEKSKLKPILCSLLIEGVAQNTNGSVFVPEGSNNVEVSGSPTEKAILHWAVQLGMNFKAARAESSIIHVFPFNSDKKRGGVAVQTTESEIHIHWKGAAEIVLGCCTQYMDVNDHLIEMDEGKMNYFRRAIEDMASRSLRCVAIAYRLYEMEKVPTSEDLAHWSLPEDNLILLAIVGLKDPCRPGVKDAVKLCQKAGVKVKMVTGDNVKTATAIAVECGILNSYSEATEPYVIIEGKDFRAMQDEERLKIVEKISVMGRSSPNDKLLLVQALRRKEHVVAVTGDGTNDAPALHEADIGLAMGIQGTEVAKESSDIIILDDNFASVVKVVRWGRSVYANIQKFIQFQLTVNIAALVINVIAAFSSGDVPLNTVQLLWVNLIMDTLGALALATEPPTDHLMDRNPMSRREPLISNIMWRNLLIQAIYQVSVLLILNFRGISILNLAHKSSDHALKVKDTLIFNAFVLCQVFNEFNARKPDEFNIFKGVTRNYLFMGIVALTVVLQIIIIEFLEKFVKTVKLTWQQWLICVIIGFISWPLAVVGKLIPVPEKPEKQLSNSFRECADRVRRCFCCDASEENHV